MFSNFTIGILAGLGFAGWVYSKLARSTGGNTTNSVVAAVLSGAIVCLLVTTILGLVL